MGKWLAILIVQESTIRFESIASLLPVFCVVKIDAFAIECCCKFQIADATFGMASS